MGSVGKESSSLKRCILTPQDLLRWKKSPSYSNIIKFTHALNTSFFSSAMQNNPSTLLIAIQELLCRLKQLTQKHPPIINKSRFGNLSFRDWYSDAKILIRQEILVILSSNQLSEYSEILSSYLLFAFGNEIRMDYGTGHELNFVLFLFCLYKLGLVAQQEFSQLVLLVMHEYFNLVRYLIVLYKLEPAGSHGSWGLDDYQFLPFLFGTAQIISLNQLMSDDCQIPSPTDTLIRDRIEIFKEKFIYFEAISFVNQYKTGSFSEHSPVLYNITSLSWNVINKGLLKMYTAEVLDKFPVVQHLEFSSLFPFLEND